MAKKNGVRMDVLERNFQRDLIKDIKSRFNGSFVIKLDPRLIQGVPDLLVLYRKHWAALEVKRSAHAPHRPNQDYRVNLMNEMSFARFIYPENKESVLNEMESAFSD